MSMTQWIVLAIAFFAADGVASPATDSPSAADRIAEIEELLNEGRHVGGPTDIEQDIDNSLPKEGSIFERIIPRDYFDWKIALYKKTGLKLAISYQSLALKATESRTGNDTAWGGWLLLEGKWEAINAGDDFEGSLVFALDWRHTIGGYSAPTRLAVDTGSGWLHDGAYVEWGLWTPVLFWEQWLAKDKFVLRFGNQSPAMIFDFFRYKDPRSSFTGAPMTFPIHVIPYPQPGIGISFEWWPIEDSELYVVGTVNDMNAKVETLGFETFFSDRQYFYGLEIGTFWRRAPDDFDHLHLDVFFADDREGAPSREGWGLKLAGSKQWDHVVAFGNYTLNTALGGGFGTTVMRHSASVGLAVNTPRGIKGEIGVGATWARPDSDGFRDQYGVEVYWKLLLAPSVWLTPLAQLIWDPTFNPSTDFLAVFGLKVRVFF